MASATLTNRRVQLEILDGITQHSLRFAMAADAEVRSAVIALLGRTTAQQFHSSWNRQRPPETDSSKLGSCERAGSLSQLALDMSTEIRTGWC